MSMKNIQDLLLKTDVDDRHFPLGASNFPSTIALSKKNKFKKIQYDYTAPCFEDASSDKTYHKDFHMPINWDESTKIKTENTSSGELYGATIGPDMHKFGAVPELVLKKIKNKSGDRELNILRHLASIPGPPNLHIAKIYSGFKYDDITYLIAERAESNLVEFTQKKSKGRQDAHIDLPWLKGQIRGLAGALRDIHYGVPGQSMYHHDIKPENILIFKNKDKPNCYDFKITDWGCAGSKTFPNNASSSIPFRIKGNPGYTPPECREAGLSSRPYDIWGMGCVFLELLIWFDRGLDALEEFRVEVAKILKAQRADDWAGKGHILISPIQRELEALGNIPSAARMVQMICAMLQIDPKARPTAKNLVDYPGFR